MTCLHMASCRLAHDPPFVKGGSFNARLLQSTQLKQSGLYPIAKSSRTCACPRTRRIHDSSRKKDNCDFPGSPLSGSSEGFGVSLFVGKLQYNVFIVRPSGSRRV